MLKADGTRRWNGDLAHRRDDPQRVRPSRSVPPPLDRLQPEHSETPLRRPCRQRAQPRLDPARSPSDLPGSSGRLAARRGRTQRRHPGRPTDCEETADRAASQRSGGQARDGDRTSTPQRRAVDRRAGRGTSPVGGPRPAVTDVDLDNGTPSVRRGLHRVGGQGQRAVELTGTGSAPVATTLPRRQLRPLAESENGVVNGVELRGLEPLTPTLPGRHDRVHSGSLRFRQPLELQSGTVVNSSAQPRTAGTATTTATSRTGFFARLLALSRPASRLLCDGDARSGRRIPTGSISSRRPEGAREQR
jgi:hypothetical protein